MKPGTKYDDNKPRWDLLPLHIIEGVVMVLNHGAKKYAPNNWQKVKPKERYFSAALRHLTAWQSGERIDKESGLLHLYHVICCIVFLIWHDEEEQKNDK